MLVDSHCHLDFLSSDHKISDILDNAKNSGVSLLQTICVKISSFNDILSIANTDPMIFCSIGTHPLNLDSEPIVNHQDILRYCNLSKVIGIGETGLDYYKSDHPEKAIQIESFIQHIKAAQSSQLPIIIHTRSADIDTSDILAEQLNQKHFTGVIHCFTGSKVLAKKCLDLGLYISASGILTFKNSIELQDIFRFIPEDRILIETDSPFLSPEPLRGKFPNTPSNVLHVAEFLANLKGMTLDKITKITTENFYNLFKKANIN